MARKLVIALSIVALLGVASVGTAQARRLSHLIAPPSVCAGETDLGDSAAVQERAMRCMTNYARQEAGLHDLGDATGLDHSAADKNHDIIRCDEFSHYACGRTRFTYWIRRTGYLAARCWRAGENIAWGTGHQATVRAIFTAWVHSPEHLANILGPYSQIGIALSVGGLDGHSKAHVWTQDFGSHCGAGTFKHHPARPHRAVRLGLGSAYIAR